MAAITGVMPTVRGEIRQSATWSIVLSVMMMVGGLLAILIPPAAGLAVTALFGWLLIVTGVMHIGLAWRGQNVAAVVGETLLAVLYAALGAYLLTRPVAGLASLALAIGVCLAVKGVLEGAVALAIRPTPGSGWLMFDGILTLLLAAMIGNAWPVSAVWTVGVLVGVALFSSGFARLMVSTAVRRAVA